MEKKVTQRSKNAVKLKLNQRMLFFEEEFEKTPVTISCIEAETCVTGIVDIYADYQEKCAEIGAYFQRWSYVDKFAALQRECRSMEEQYQEFLQSAQIHVTELADLAHGAMALSSQTEVKQTLFKEVSKSQHSRVDTTLNISPTKSDLLTAGDQYEKWTEEKEDIAIDNRMHELEAELTMLKLEKNLRKPRYMQPELFHQQQEVTKQPFDYIPIVNTQEIGSYSAYKASRRASPLEVSQLNPTSTPFEVGRRAHGMSIPSWGSRISGRGQPIHVDEDTLSECSNYTEYKSIKARSMSKIETATLSNQQVSETVIPQNSVRLTQRSEDLGLLFTPGSIRTPSNVAEEEVVRTETDSNMDDRVSTATETSSQELLENPYRRQGGQTSVEYTEQPTTLLPGRRNEYVDYGMQTSLRLEEPGPMMTDRQLQTSFSSYGAYVNQNRRPSQAQVQATMSVTPPLPLPPEDPLGIVNNLLNRLQYRDHRTPQGGREMGRMEKYLHKIQVPEFSGDVQQFPSWWSTWMYSVDSDNTPVEVKLLRLKGVLKGEPKKMLDLLDHSPEAYFTIMARLEKKYGGSRRMLTNKLNDVVKSKPVRDEVAKDMERFAEMIESLIVSLRASGMKHSLSDSLMYFNLLQKLSSGTLTRYNRWLADAGMDSEHGTIYQLKEFVETEAQHMVLASEIKNSMKPVVQSTMHQSGRYHKTTFVSNTENENAVSTVAGAMSARTYKKRPFQKAKEKEKVKCKLCEGDHHLYLCGKFKDLPVEDRWFKAREYRICFRCLNFSQHRYDECPEKKLCGMNGCTLKHHPLLHNPRRSRPPTGEDKQTLLTHTSGFVSLRTIPVWVVNGQKRIQIILLLDDASSQTYISDTVANELQLQRAPNTFCVGTLAGQTQSINSSVVEFTLEGIDGKVSEKVSAQTLNTITGALEAVNWAEEKFRWSHLEGISFTDTGPDKKIDMLLGIDYHLLHNTEDERYGSEVDPVARLTPLGWCCVGPIPSPIQSKKVRNEVSLHGVKSSEESKLICLIEQSWNVDSEADRNYVSPEDQNALDIADRTFTKVQGHYQIGLPWKKGKTKEMLPNNELMAKSRLFSTERKLNADVRLRDMYREVMKDYQRKEYIELVYTDSSLARIKYFIPHFPVVKLDKITTKVRVVYDASAQAQNISLNDLLETGPKLQSDVVNVLSRFRRHAIAVASDIKEMYLQISLPEDDREATQFLWRDCTEEKRLAVYRYRCQLFGLRSSPFNAQYTTKRHAKEHVEKYPRAAESVIDSTYMDDTLDSVKDVTSGIQLFKESKQLWQEAGMKVCKWASNSNDVLQVIPQEERFKSIDLKAETAINMKTLGVSWQSDKDEFTFHVKPSPEEITTKRLLLKKVATIYDPLGFVTPVVIGGRILLQEVWLSGEDWDEELCTPMKKRIANWIQEVYNLQQITVPRVLQTQSNPLRQEIHTFVDASERAYGAVSYLLSEYDEGLVEVKIIASKVKVAPVKMMSIPRLELLAAMVGVKLATKLAKVLECKSDVCFYWSDSQNILFWIKRPARGFKQFVANRVCVIQEKTETKNWRYINTRSNPADIASRGVTTAVLRDHSGWWAGPDYLRQPASEWPYEEKFDTPTEKSELRRTENTYVNLKQAVPESSHVPEALSLVHFSKLKKACRVMAWVLRFVAGCQRKVPKIEQSYLTADEILEARNVYIRSVQRQTYIVEIKCLIAKKDVPNSSRLSVLHPWMDEDDMLRVDGRTKMSDCLSWSSKFPIILPKSSRFVRLMVQQVHADVAHGGTNRVLSEICLEYWIPNAREVIKKILAECVICRKSKGKALTQLMAPLPQDRTARTLQVFEAASVDMAGPFMTKQGRGKTRLKRYIALFTCMSVRAVHLEVVQGMDVDSFMDALVRMAARRGCPKRMYSDNGSNFIAAKKELTELRLKLRDQVNAERHKIGKRDKRVKTEMVEEQLKLDPEELGAAIESKGVTWKMNTPCAPHHGGVHEALVKSAKTAMKNVIGRAELTDFELITVVTAVEGLLNGRPLSYQSTDVRDDLPLTPNNFLISRVGAQLRPEEVDPSMLDLTRRWRRLQEVITHFWSRWMKECVPLLNSRPKWKTAMSNVKIGEIILVVDSESPRGTWPIAKVVRVYPGPDGKVRSVDVQMNNKIYKRPITKIIPLLHEDSTME